MSLIIGYIDGEKQELTFVNGLVHINNAPQPIKNVTQEEIDALVAELETVPNGDAEGQEAYRNSRRINFLLSLLSRAFGDECSNMLEHMIGNLHYRVLEYLGETDDLDEYVESKLPKPRHDDIVHHHHGDGCCGHDHEGHDHHEH